MHRFSIRWQFYFVGFVITSVRKIEDKIDSFFPSYFYFNIGYIRSVFSILSIPT